MKTRPQKRIKIADHNIVRACFTGTALVKSLLVFFFCTQFAYSESAEFTTLTTAQSILSLDYNEAGKEIPVLMTGMVTAQELDWKGQFFIQDETGGVFVENLNGPVPKPGEIIELTGQTAPGAFAPIVSRPKWKKIGDDFLPAALSVSIDDLMLGIHDGKRVQVSGVIRSFVQNEYRWIFYLWVGGYELELSVPLAFSGNPNSLVGATVLARGTTATHYNTVTRNLMGVAVYVPDLSDFVVLKQDLDDPFDEEVIALGSVAKYRVDGVASKRVHLNGWVTFQQEGQTVFIQDETAGLQIITDTPLTFDLGERVEVSGFLEFENHLPILKNGVFRRSGKIKDPIEVSQVNMNELLAGKHHGEVIRLRGTVWDRSIQPSRRSENGFDGKNVTLFIIDEKLRFSVEYETDDEHSFLSMVPIGSVIEVDGVCFSEVNLEGMVQSFKILLSTDEHVKVLRQPAWLTPRRLAIGILFLGGLLSLALIWTLIVSKKNKMLKFLLSERETNQRLLQEAHDKLEEKVVVRTRQLKTEMTERKEAEVEHKATLTERTRLARELHDTLEQTLTGISLQLSTVSRNFETEPEQSIEHLSTARKWLSASQAQLRHSIWDLRSRELEQFNLTDALKRTAENVVDGTEIKLLFRSEGLDFKLPETYEENLLRIGQEAMTNMVKHSNATTVDVLLVYSHRSLILKIADNGSGFNIEESASVKSGHYGLLGMHERAKRISGTLTVDSQIDQGTSVEISVPLIAEIEVESK